LLLTPHGWFDDVLPWHIAAETLFLCGFAQAAAFAYHQLLKRLYKVQMFMFLFAYRFYLYAYIAYLHCTFHTF